jgi:hypothetical protein
MRLKAMAPDKIWYMDAAKWEGINSSRDLVDWNSECMSSIEFAVPEFVTTDSWTELREQLTARAPVGYVIDKLVCNSYYSHPGASPSNRIINNLMDYNRCFFHPAPTVHITRPPGRHLKLIVFVKPSESQHSKSHDGESPAGESLQRGVRSQWQALERRLELYL